MFFSLFELYMSVSALPLELKATLLDALEEHLAEMSISSVVWSLWALGKMSFDWSSSFSGSLKDKIEAVLLQRMQPENVQLSKRDFGVVFWAILALKAPLNELNLTLRNTFVKGVDYLLEGGRRKFAVPELVENTKNVENLQL